VVAAFSFVASQIFKRKNNSIFYAEVHLGDDTAIVLTPVKEMPKLK
jgi:hypothetical protein